MANVGGHGEGTPTSGHALERDCLESLLVAGDQHDRCTPLRKFERGRKADAARSASQDDDLLFNRFEVKAHCRFLPQGSSEALARAHAALASAIQSSSLRHEPGCCEFDVTAVDRPVG
jgi:hypothetical protein